MSTEHDTMIDPPIEDLLEAAGSKFALVILAAKRARQINTYHSQLGAGIKGVVPPQVTSLSAKALSVAFEEIAAGKIVPVEESEPETSEWATSGDGTGGLEVLPTGPGLDEGTGGDGTTADADTGPEAG